MKNWLYYIGMELGVGFHGIWQSSEAEWSKLEGLTLLVYLCYVSIPSVA